MYIHAGEDKDIFLQSDLFCVTGLQDWEKIPFSEQTPPDRYGHTTIALDGTLVCFGGYGGEMTIYNDVFRFSLGK